MMAEIDVRKSCLEWLSRPKQKHILDNIIGNNSEFNRIMGSSWYCEGCGRYFSERSDLDDRLLCKQCEGST